MLLAFQWAFTNILEISLLLTGLMGQFAVAGSLLPFEAKPLFAWLTGFFSLGMAQVSYIIVGLARVVVVNADVTDTLGFLVIIGLLAPALTMIDVVCQRSRLTYNSGTWRSRFFPA